MNKPKNSFIHSALEAMKLDAPTVTEIEMEPPTDAVAELMERNATLENEKLDLEQDTFDNDVQAVSAVSDSVNQDLEEVVKAGAALEQLSQLCQHAVASGQANQASVAGFAFGLEQIVNSIGIPGVMAGLEGLATGVEDAGEQTKLIGEQSKATQETLTKRLVDGIQRIVGWLINVIRNALSRNAEVAKKARELGNRSRELDETKTIDSKAFINSLGLVEGAGDAPKQFEDYFELANKTLYGVFGEKFEQHLKEITLEAAYEEEVNPKLTAVVKNIMEAIYPENGTVKDAGINIPEGIDQSKITVGLTKPCVGGLQLYMAASNDSPNTNSFYCRAGVCAGGAKRAEPDTIPVLDAQLFKRGLGNVEAWVSDQRKLEERLKSISRLTTADRITSAGVTDINNYLKVLSAITTGCIPQLLRLNMRNATNFVAYAEKSLAASTASVAK